MQIGNANFSDKFIRPIYSSNLICRLVSNSKN